MIQTEIFDNNQQGFTNSTPSASLPDTIPNNPPSFAKTDEELSIKHSNPISVTFLYYLKYVNRFLWRMEIKHRLMIWSPYNKIRWLHQALLTRAINLGASFKKRMSTCLSQMLPQSRNSLSIRRPWELSFLSRKQRVLQAPFWIDLILTWQWFRILLLCCMRAPSLKCQGLSKNHPLPATIWAKLLLNLTLSLISK